MTFDKTFFETDLKNVIADDPIEIELEQTSENEKHNGIKSSLINAQDIVAAGLSNSYLFSVTILISDWDVLPQVDDILIIEEVRYAVMRRGKDSVDIGLRVDLAAENDSGSTGPAYMGRL